MFCRLRTSATILPSILALLAGTQALVAVETTQVDKIKQLMEKRVTIRTRVLETATAGYRQGSVSFDQVLEAQTSLLRAKLDLCETKEQRIEIYDAMVRVAETSLELAKKQVQAGVATQLELLKAEAQLVEMQIGREKVK